MRVGRRVEDCSRWYQACGIAHQTSPWPSGEANWEGAGWTQTLAQAAVSILARGGRLGRGRTGRGSGLGAKSVSRVSLGCPSDAHKDTPSGEVGP